MPFQRPTAAELEQLKAQAAHWIRKASRSSRQQQQAALPRGQREVFQLKIVLENSKPPIWRRVLVPSELTLWELHHVIQRAMGWHNEHLYQFVVGTRQEGLRYYGDTVAFEMDLWLQAQGEFMDDGKVRLDHLLVDEKDWIRYIYDMGDSWQHRITLETIQVKPLQQARIPRCIGGRRACPPEDSGGMPGYERALMIQADPAHPEHGDIMEWLEGPIDPAAFDCEAADAAVQEGFAETNGS